MFKVGISGIALAMFAVSAAGLATPSAAQTVFPEPGRPFVFINSFAPGGQNQRALQDFQPFFEAELGTSVEIETVEGAAGLIGYNTVYSRPADGYTAILASATYGPYLYPHLSQSPPPWTYDDWALLGIYSDHPSPGIITLADSPYKTFPELIAAAKANPGEITFGTNGPGRIEDVQIVELEKVFGVDFNHVYYDSGATLFTDLLTGDLDVIIAAALPYAEDPQVNITLLIDKLPEGFEYPDMATIGDYEDELGFEMDDTKTLNVSLVAAVYVKAGLPDDVYQKLVDTLHTVVENPEWREKVKDYRNPVWVGPEEAKARFDRINAGIAELIAEVKAQ